MLSRTGQIRFSMRLPDMSDLINVEVVFGMPDSQQLVSVSMPPGSTVADALEVSKIAAAFPDAAIAHLPTGIWGRPVHRDQTLVDGDRVEVYRELEVDPREARRLRALD